MDRPAPRRHRTTASGRSPSSGFSSNRHLCIERALETRGPIWRTKTGPVRSRASRSSRMRRAALSATCASSRKQMHGSWGSPSACAASSTAKNSRRFSSQVRGHLSRISSAIGTLLASTARTWPARICGCQAGGLCVASTSGGSGGWNCVVKVRCWPTRWLPVVTVGFMSSRRPQIGRRRFRTGGTWPIPVLQAVAIPVR